MEKLKIKFYPLNNDYIRTSESIMINKIIQFKDLGKNQDYIQTWNFQEELLQKIIEKKRNHQTTENHLFFVEHPHVYTLGKSGNEENLLANQHLLEQINATFVKTNRGGDITYHGPNQLVGYPVLDLDNFKTDINWYLRSLEEIIIKTIAEYGLQGERSKGETGVWLDVGKPFARKICAMGVKTSRWVTMHGFALNVNTDLRYFEYIIPCGIKDKQVTSLQRELRQEINIEEVKQKLLKHFANVFETDVII